MHFFQESNSSTAASMPYPKVAPFYFSYVTLQTIDSEEFFFLSFLLFPSLFPYLTMLCQTLTPSLLSLIFLSGCQLYFSTREITCCLAVRCKS